MEKIVSVRLVPKRLKGKNRIREARTDHWLVDAEGKFQGAPALLVYPADNRNMLRWVLIIDDRDFEIADYQTEPEGKGT